MGVVAIACYRPKPGKDDALLDLMRKHMPTLREQGLVEDTQSICGRSRDGAIIEVFAWKSQDAIASAHENPAVLAMWNEYDAVCDYVPVATIAEAQELFSPLTHIDLN